jgi:hypothetical protein
LCGPDELDLLLHSSLISDLKAWSFPQSYNYSWIKNVNSPKAFFSYSKWWFSSRKKIKMNEWIVVDRWCLNFIDELIALQIKHFCAGAAARCTAATIMFPVDTVKTRLQFLANTSQSLLQRYEFNWIEEFDGFWRQSFFLNICKDPNLFWCLIFDVSIPLIQGIIALEKRFGRYITEKESWDSFEAFRSV